MLKKLYFILGIALCIFASACLKTRAQLREQSREEQEKAYSPQPGQVQDVQPQGKYVIDEIKSEITRLTGRIDDLERAKQEPLSKSPDKEELKKLETRIIELEQAQATMLEAIKKFQVITPSIDHVDLFEKGKKQMTAKEYDAAIESFNQYLKNPKSNKAEEATFLRAEAYFNSKQFKKAIIDYSKLQEKFNRSHHIPVALFKIAVSFESLGMKEDAKSFYQEVVDKFPKTPEAKKAKTKLSNK